MARGRHRARAAFQLRRLAAPRPRTRSLPSVTATFAKNEFGQLLDQVIRHGAVAITKHRAAKAVLVSMDEYQALTGSAEDDLDVLAAEFDELLERMQTPAARKAMAAAFAASPARLRQAAVKAARKRS